MSVSTTRAIRASAILIAALGVQSTHAQIAKGQCKYLGNIITNGVPGDYNTYWNQASPENSGKWSSIQSSVKSTNYNWSGFQTVYDWGKKTGNPVKFHVLVWGSQQPNDAGSATIDDIKRWFKAVHDKYPDLQQIDVVNEAFPGGSWGSNAHAPAPYRGALKAAASSYGIPAGEFDWIFVAFKMARELWKDSTKTVLIYNDYNTAEYAEEAKWQEALAKAAKEQKIPIDAIGYQAHDAWMVPTATVKSNIDKITALGFPVYITEYDVGIDYKLTRACNAGDDADQKRIVSEQMTMFWNHPNVKGVTYWGLKNGATWRPCTGLFNTNGSLRPAMQWLKDWIPANQAVCGTPSGVTRSETGARRTLPGMVMRNVDGRLVMGVERNGLFQEVSALGRN